MENRCNRDKVSRLLEKGATIPNPSTIDIGDEVSLDRISGEGVTLYSGCKIYGKKTLIMPGSKLGYEAPVTVQDCQIARGVELKGGYFRESVFLDGSNMGSCAQVRDACLFEEEANGAHSVGLKHTILFPFVTLGSLINFCDCLMAGGTSRKDHSEVGSSYIHFNYTPNQDKATASLIGDVPKGVMLDQRPVFLGGQGGLVGPARLGFGTVIAAGVVFRGDSPEGGRLIFSEGTKGVKMEFYPGVYWGVKRRVLNNINYCSNLIALKSWYLRIRSQFFKKIPLGEELCRGALDLLDLAIDERIKRFRALVQKFPKSAKMYQEIKKERSSKELLNQKREISEGWQSIEDLFYGFMEGKAITHDCAEFKERMACEIEQKGTDYTSVIQGLDKETRSMGTKWLEGIVTEINERVLEKIPSFNR